MRNWLADRPRSFYVELTCRPRSWSVFRCRRQRMSIKFRVSGTDWTRTVSWITKAVRSDLKRSIRLLLTVLSLAFLIPVASSAAPQSRISENVNYQQRTRLQGHIHPNATAENDVGALDAGQVLSGITLVLKPTAEQDAQLSQLLADQQDPGSASYHKWISPEDYAERFGLSDEDLQKVRTWLESQNLT